MRRFEIRGQRANLPYEVIIGARYCLCTALDEAAALTPWGNNSVWSGSGLLVTFHNETWGGEKFSSCWPSCRKARASTSTCWS